MKQYNENKNSFRLQFEKIVDLEVSKLKNLKNKNSLLSNYKKINSTIKDTKNVILKENSVKSKDIQKKKTLIITAPTIVQSPINFGITTVKEAEDLYFKTITKDTIKCTESKRFGRSDDGGWDVCMMEKLKPDVNNCMVYSFGVNYIWEFDDELSQKYKCIVRTFDPSMSKEPDQYQRPSKVWFYKLGLGKENVIWNNGWKIKTLSSIMKQFNEQNRIIDILKIDIEFSEWDSFTSITNDGLFSNVKQLLFETHTEEVQGRSTSFQSYIRFLKIWNSLYKSGFRQWKHHWNHFGNFNSPSGISRTCCYEHYLINSNFL